MENKQYLTFGLHSLQYGLEAALIQEIFPLPELISISEAPKEIIGLLNLRGQIIPTIHLDLLQGHLVKEIQISDCVIVVQWEGLHFGIVVHQTNDVVELNAEIIETEPSKELLCNINTALIIGIAKLDVDDILLLDPNALISQPDALLPLIWDAQNQIEGMVATPLFDAEQLLEQDDLKQADELQTPTISASFYDVYCPNATAEERLIFRERADALRQPIESAKATNELMQLAVIGFGNDYFGLDLELVKEFTDIANLTPIPCCPKHIVGNMNLRGEIVTLVDIRNVLNLPTRPISIGSHVVVVQVDDIVAGLPVDRVSEMVEVNTTELAPLPAVLSDLGEQYLRGTAFFQERLLKVLDLPKIFTQGGLVVNEQA